MALAQVIPLYLLPKGAQPRPADLLPYEHVKNFRHLGCGGYGGCLNFAVRANWTGFHCLRCPRFAAATAVEVNVPAKLTRVPALTIV